MGQLLRTAEVVGLIAETARPGVKCLVAATPVACGHSGERHPVSLMGFDGQNR